MALVNFANKTQTAEYAPEGINAQDMNELKASCNNFATARVVSTGSRSIALPHVYDQGSIRMFRNGSRIDPDMYTHSGAQTLLLTFDPESGDVFVIDYRYTSNV